MGKTKEYYVIANQAVVLDAVDAIYHAELRLDSILGHIPHSTRIKGVHVDYPITQDFTAHALQITWPLDVEPHAGIIAYVLLSQLDEVRS